MKIHRFKCSKELNEEIMNFSEIHKFDTDEILAEQWTEWMETIKHLVERESAYLSRYDYELPIETKIFKSIKYYYIKKFLKTKIKKPYIKREIHNVSVEIMEAIKTDLKNHFDLDPDFKPALTYEKFKNNLLDPLDDPLDDPLIKKSYKNQYYQMKNKRYL